MGLFKRRTRSGTQGFSQVEPKAGECACTEHTRQAAILIGTVPGDREDPVGGAMDAQEVADEFIGVHWAPVLLDEGSPQEHRYYWDVFLQDEVRHLYYDLPDAQTPEGKDGFELLLEEHPQIVRAAHSDTEVVHLDAPGLCEDGVRAVMLRALIAGGKRVGLS